MAAQHETLLLVSALAALAALFPLFFSYASKYAPPTAPSPDPSMSAPLAQAKPVPIRALVPYLLAVPRAIIAIPSKPIGFAAYYIVLVAAPLLVVLDALFSLLRLPFRALVAVLSALYPIYVLCGTAILTGAAMGGLVVVFVKFVLLVQEVRRNRTEMDEHNERKKERRYTRARDRYYQ
ncbi:hypothetical protein FRC08_009141 [Ceratobasidium sp. 394]|nr:hypothetical protein FRC08_009141 [Ceratobasidium sp. 394]